MALLMLFSLGVLVFTPRHAEAFNVVDFVKNLFGIPQNESVESNTVAEEAPSRPFPFLSAVSAADPKAAEKNTDLQIVDSITVASSVGPLGNVAEASDSSISYKITSYTVRPGDTLGVIAKSFGVTVSTIRWANDIPKNGVLKEGTVLLILPVSGVQHTVGKGDTIASIAKKYGGDPDDIVSFNNLDPKHPLAVGDEIIIPDGEMAAPVATPSKSSPSAPLPTLVRGGGADLGGYYTRPLLGGIRTQGLHGYNGVDLGAPRGTPVYAAASGTIITARSSGWNGGYGEFIVIAHPNGTQTLYAHLSSVFIAAGASVEKGQQIGLVGATGKATGPHLHFEIRGAKNPF